MASQRLIKISGIVRLHSLKTLICPSYVHISKYSSSSAVSNNLVKVLLQKDPSDDKVMVSGWIKSVRKHKNVNFVHLNDGSCSRDLQIIVDENELPPLATFGSCVQVQGKLVKSPASGQPVEMQADDVEVLGSCDDAEFPFKHRKRDPQDYVRKFLHLRPKTNFHNNLLRARNCASQGIHEYFQANNFCEIQTPILSSNDCEGAGEVFQVEPTDEAKNGIESDKEESNPHFFNKPTFLTVSGQLHLEVINGGFARAYNFSPTFRAESSSGRHHLSEFTMVEAELSFIRNTNELANVIENLLKHSAERITTKSSEEFQFFKKFVAPQDHRNVINNFINRDYVRMTYTEAVEIIQKHEDKFKIKVTWGDDFLKEHEKFIVKHCDDTPVFITDYPKHIKPFYMRINEDDKTVAGLDLLAPGVGELCGGSLREERYDNLFSKLDKLGLTDSLSWYLDLRKFGSAPHGGFGIGFERFIQMMLGITNIKDCLPFPRSRRNCRL